MAHAVERHVALLHRLEQGGLGLGGAAVDLVGQEQLGEDRPPGQGEARRLEVEQVGAEDVARREVRGELDTAIVQRHGASEAAHEQRLGHPRRPLHQHMPPRQEGGEEEVDHPRLPHHAPADLFAYPARQRPHLSRVHASSPVSTSMCGAPRPKAPAHP